MRFGSVRFARSSPEYQNFESLDVLKSGPSIYFLSGTFHCAIVKRPKDIESVAIKCEQSCFLIRKLWQALKNAAFFDRFTTYISLRPRGPKLYLFAVIVERNQGDEDP